jgi:hypothetical protein
MPVLCAGLCLGTSSSLACRYNVRDVGFVDLDAEAYHLYALAGPEIQPDTLARIRTRSVEWLRDSNVSLELVQTSQEPNHPALQHCPPSLGSTEMAAVLVSPDGPSLLLDTARSATEFERQLEAMLSSVVASPVRDEILGAVTQHFATVLLLEGESEPETDRARSAIREAIGQIRGQMTLLPKAIASPPTLVTLSLADLARERVLLWSLGLGTAREAAPRAAVLYGRARWIGPLMKGEEITAHNVAGILSIIGADCECGLDIGWTQGTRLPVRWTEAIQASLAKALGFDPENPLVKVEMSRIITRRGSGQPAAGMGYQELSLDGPTAPAPEPSRTVTNRAGASAPVAKALSATAVPAAENRTVVWKWGAALGAGAALVLLAGLIIVIRAKQ